MRAYLLLLFVFFLFNSAVDAGLHDNYKPQVPGESILKSNQDRCHNAAKNPLFDAVGKIRISSLDGTKSYSGSGTYIGLNEQGRAVILTAAHVVNKVNTEMDISEGVEVLVGQPREASIRFSPRKGSDLRLEIEKVIMPAQYIESDITYQKAYLDLKEMRSKRDKLAAQQESLDKKYSALKVECSAAEREKESCKGQLKIEKLNRDIARLDKNKSDKEKAKKQIKHLEQALKLHSEIVSINKINLEAADRLKQENQTKLDRMNEQVASLKSEKDLMFDIHSQFDIAMAVISEKDSEKLADSTIEPLEMLSSGSDLQAQFPAVMVGFGCSDQGNLADGKKKASAQFVTYGKSYRFLRSAQNNAESAKKKRMLIKGYRKIVKNNALSERDLLFSLRAQGGDSGGALLMLNKAGKTVVAGVLSHGVRFPGETHRNQYSAICYDKYDEKRAEDGQRSTVKSLYSATLYK